MQKGGIQVSEAEVLPVLHSSDLLTRLHGRQEGIEGDSFFQVA